MVDRKGVKISVGDRIFVPERYCSDIRFQGWYGTVVSIRANLGVEFDDSFPAGHSCDGYGKDGHCWYTTTGRDVVVVREAEKAYDDKELSIKFSELFEGSLT